MKESFAMAAALFLSAGLPSVTFGDSITPSSYSATLGVGESATITKTVTVDSGPPTSSKVDVFFLADETGSMGGQIAAVKASASAILASTAALGDVAFGVGGYRDVGDAFVYRELTDLTSTQGTVQTAINTWAASGGGDFPEANLFGLQQVANTTSWRAGSERILIWFGDAPGHDPSSGATEASATAALTANSINVQAINVGSSTGGLNETGQAARITAATGGTFFNGIATSDLVSVIMDAISSAISEYSTVGIDTSEVPAGVSVAVSPLSVTGSFDRSITRTFDFGVTFAGLTPGTYAFNLYGTVDGGRVATEADRIVVTDGTTPPSGVPDGGSTLLLLGLGIGSLGSMRRHLIG
jgi:hypothetical protein